MGLLEGGSRASDVARRFGCNERTRYRLQLRVRQTGSVNDRAPITTPQEDSYMVTSLRRHRFMLATNLVQRLRQATGTRISVYTDRNRLSAARLRARRLNIGVPLTQCHRVARLDWARRHSRWVRQRWNGLTEIGPMVEFVWHRRGERLDPAKVVECDGYGGGSVMLWGGVYYEGKTELKNVRERLNAARYCAATILPAVVSYIHNGNADVFQQDNHVVILLFTHVTSNNINALEWPSRSLYLTPLLHM